MPQTPAPHPDIARAHHAANVRRSAVKIEAAAKQILIDAARGHLVRSSGRLIAAEVIALCEAIALLADAEKAVAKQRGEVAA